MSGDDPDLWYPTVDDIVEIHDMILEDDPNSEPGVENRERIEFAVDYIQEGHFGEVPETIHEKAFHLMRLIAANHWFTDGNKRTALHSTVLFYSLNGIDLEVGRDIKSMVMLFSVRENLVDRQAGVDYLQSRTKPLKSAEFLEGLSDKELLALVLYAIGRDVERTDMFNHRNG